jgi:hypothetical protein
MRSVSPNICKDPLPNQQNEAGWKNTGQTMSWISKIMKPHVLKHKKITYVSCKYREDSRNTRNNHVKRNKQTNARTQYNPAPKSRHRQPRLPNPTPTSQQTAQLRADRQNTSEATLMPNKGDSRGLTRTHEEDSSPEGGPSLHQVTNKEVISWQLSTKLRQSAMMNKRG